MGRGSHARGGDRGCLDLIGPGHHRRPAGFLALMRGSISYRADINYIRLEPKSYFDAES